MVPRLCEDPFAVVLANQLNLCVTDAITEPLRHIHSIENLRVDSPRDMTEQHLRNLSQPFPLNDECLALMGLRVGGIAEVN